MNAKNFEYNGRKMSEAEAVSRQRQIERNIRRWKREYAAMKEAGLPTDEAASRIVKWQNIQTDFLKQTGLKRNTAREQIAGFGKSQAQKVVWANKKAVSGLSAKSDKQGMKKSIPKFTGKIDVSDKKLVQSKVREFENWAVEQPVEHAFVILNNGKTYQFAGGVSGVNPESLGQALKNSVITHNHPRSVTEYSLSRADLELMIRYQGKQIHGRDYKYRYFAHNKGYSLQEFQNAYDRALVVAKQTTSILEGTEDFIHNINVALAEKGLIEYKRVLINEL